LFGNLTTKLLRKQLSASVYCVATENRYDEDNVDFNNCNRWVECWF